MNKRKLKIAGIVFLLLFGIAYIGNLNHEKQEKERIAKEKVDAENKKIEDERIRLETEKSRLAIQAKKDSSQVYFDTATKNSERKRYKQALVGLDSALLIYPENYEAQLKKGIVLKKMGKYQESIRELDALSNITGQFKSDIYLIKGQCLLKLKKKEDAIVQVFEAAELDNEEAKKLYDKINPIIKDIIGYQRRCCDGTTSDSEGRGTCSRHGGVCKWNEPIYNERRKYRITKK